MWVLHASSSWVTFVGTCACGVSLANCSTLDVCACVADSALSLTDNHFSLRPVLTNPSLRHPVGDFGQDGSFVGSDLVGSCVPLRVLSCSVDI